MALSFATTIRFFVAPPLVSGRLNEHKPWVRPNQTNFVRLSCTNDPSQFMNEPHRGAVDFDGYPALRGDRIASSERVRDHRTVEHDCVESGGPFVRPFLGFLKVELHG